LSFCTSAVRCNQHICSTLFRNVCGTICLQCTWNFNILKCLFLLQSVYFGSFLGRPTFPVFRFSSPASNRTVFVLILSPVLGLANALLGGSNVVLGFGWLATWANKRESTPASHLVGGGARTGCTGGRTAWRWLAWWNNGFIGNDVLCRRLWPSSLGQSRQNPWPSQWGSTFL
jgi:hypothetical protein